jgi:alcohol dehydrogenase
MLSDNVFEIQPGVAAHFGCGSVERLPRLVRLHERDRALVVTDPGVERAGVVARVVDVLRAAGVAAEVSSAPRRNPCEAGLASLVAEARAQPTAVLIAVGGGAVIESTKVVSLLAANGGSVSDYPPGCRPGRPGVPVLAVPTTAGSGSETHMLAHVLDPSTRRFVALGHVSVRPVCAVLDPELTLSLPADVTATSGVRALVQATEAFISNRRSPLTDALSLRSLAAIATHIGRAHRDPRDIEARSELLFAAHLSGLAAASAGGGLCQAMARPVSARLEVTRGQALATFLPHVLRFAFGVCEARYAQLAIALGAAAPGVSEAENAHRAISAIERIFDALGVARTATALGVLREHVATLTDDAMADVALAGAPRFPEGNDVLALYEAAL